MLLGKRNKMFLLQNWTKFRKKLIDVGMLKSAASKMGGGGRLFPSPILESAWAALLRARHWGQFTGVLTVWSGSAYRNNCPDLLPVFINTKEQLHVGQDLTGIPLKCLLPYCWGGRVKSSYPGREVLGGGKRRGGQTEATGEGTHFLNTVWTNWLVLDTIFYSHSWQSSSSPIWMDHACSKVFTGFLSSRT